MGPNCAFPSLDGKTSRGSVPCPRSQLITWVNPRGLWSTDRDRHDLQREGTGAEGAAPLPNLPRRLLVSIPTWGSPKQASPRPIRWSPINPRSRTMCHSCGWPEHHGWKGRLSFRTPLNSILTCHILGGLLAASENLLVTVPPPLPLSHQKQRI